MHPHPSPQKKKKNKNLAAIQRRNMTITLAPKTKN